jgi:hypothetical protein
MRVFPYIPSWFTIGGLKIESRPTNHESRISRGLIAGFALCAACAGDPAAADFAFGALGDMPYSADEEERFPGLIAEMGRENLAFIVHVGDFKRATETCSDEVYLERRGWFEASPHPFIYVPGDNDWTDCRRPFGAARDPLERLDKLRELFFSEETTFGRRKLRLERQPRLAGGPRYPEHARWEHQGILFLTLNAPGHNNHQTGGEYAARNSAVRQWLTESFAGARARGLRGVVVLMHGNPWNNAGHTRSGFTGLIETLAAETRAFSGAVLLVNGDSHRYRVDQLLRDPATGAPLGNFLRVMVFGSPSLRWVRIRVSEAAGRVRFEAEPGD